MSRGGLGYTCLTHFCQTMFLRLLQIWWVFQEARSRSVRLETLVPLRSHFARSWHAGLQNMESEANFLLPFEVQNTKGFSFRGLRPLTLWPGALSLDPTGGSVLRPTPPQASAPRSPCLFTPDFFIWRRRWIKLPAHSVPNRKNSEEGEIMFVERATIDSVSAAHWSRCRIRRWIMQQSPRSSPNSEWSRTQRSSIVSTTGRPVARQPQSRPGRQRHQMTIRHITQLSSTIRLITTKALPTNRSILRT